jgi:hypothetical protein
LNASKGVDEARCISSDELAEWLRDVDAGEMVMVVDACHSAGAIKNNDFKPGPMGSRGLGQLAYDKGMRMLAATQVEGVALELENLKQGVLTYALVRDGLESGQADYKPKDESLTLQEWLNYGADRVPGLYEDIRAGRVKALGGAASRDPIIRIDGDANASFLKTGSLLQQPLLFDFSKKQNHTLLIGNDPYTPIRPDFDRLQFQPDTARERLDLAAAADLQDAKAAAEALRKFIAAHYDRPSGVFARILLIGALLEANVYSGDLVGACRDVNAFLRDTSPTGRMYRVRVYKTVAAELARRGDRLSEATEFVEKALTLLPPESPPTERADLQKLLSTLKQKTVKQ